MASRVVEVDLVSADAEAPNDQQVLGLGKDAVCQLGLGANSNYMDITWPVSEV